MHNLAIIISQEFSYEVCGKEAPTVILFGTESNASFTLTGFTMDISERIEPNQFKLFHKALDFKNKIKTEGRTIFYHWGAGYS
jgi:hypothetical protein